MIILITYLHVYFQSWNERILFSCLYAFAILVYGWIETFFYTKNERKNACVFPILYALRLNSFEIKYLRMVYKDHNNIQKNEAEKNTWK